MAEYVKGVGRSEEDNLAQPKAESSYMGVDDADEAPAQPAAEPKQEAPGAGKFGAWVSAEGDGADDAEDADMADAEEEEKDEDDALIHEKAIGKGQSFLENSVHLVPEMQQDVLEVLCHQPLCTHEKGSYLGLEVF